MARCIRTLYGMALIVTLTGPPLLAQAPAPEPSDVGSVDAIIAALYDVISGPAGETRDWDRFRSLFRSEAKLIPIARGQGQTRDGAFYHSVEEYIQRSGPVLEERGFFEQEIGRVEERFENIVHAFSTYTSRWTPEGEVFQRGINSIQLMWDGERWWIVNIMWRGVGPDTEIPERYRRK